MNLIKIFTREEPIAGLEISETHIKLAFLALETPSKKVKNGSPILRIKALTEEPLPPGVIEGGVVLNPEALTASIIKLLKKSPTVRYFIVSIPGDKVYQKVFTFPKTVQEERLIEAMKLATTFQLPFASETAYIDWEKLSSNEQNDVFLAAVPQPVIERFVLALARAGVKTVAIETRGMSLGRAMENGDQTMLVRDLGKTDLALYVLKSGIPRFGRILPASHIHEDAASAEMEKIKKFYEVEWKESIPRVVDLDQVPLLPTLASELKHLGNTADKTTWSVALGAALRGLLPRSEDTIVSILPVGTEEAYEYQKAAAFAKFIAHTAVGLALFWIAIFFGAWTLLSVIQENSNKELSALSQAPVSAENLALEDRAKQFNDIVAETHSILATFPSWSIIVEEIRTRIIPGISISMFGAPAPDGVLSLNGMAATRADLNKFKKSLEGSGMIAEVNLPITNLEQKANIPFSATFRMRDPQILFKSNQKATQ